MDDLSHLERIAVSGATGFIGRHLVERVVAAGARPVRLSRAPQPAAFPGRAVEWAELDLFDSRAIESVLGRVRPRTLFHLAGTRGVREPSSAVADCARLNVAATADVLQAAMRCGVSRILILGTAEEYGPQGGPLGEDMVLQPNTAYGITKAAATRLAQLMHRENACPVVVLRPFTVYGPGQPLDMFVAAAIDAALTGRPFEMSAGEQRRDLVLVDDLVEALLVAALAPGIEGRAINVGTGQTHPLRDVATRIWEITASKAPLRIGARPASAGQLHDTWADTRLARRLLGWEPRFDLDHGLMETVRRSTGGA
jgi:nucleoside-diphosphate-sugar epimerase